MSGTADALRRTFLIFKRGGESDCGANRRRRHQVDRRAVIPSLGIRSQPSETTRSPTTVQSEPVAPGHIMGRAGDRADRGVRTVATSLGRGCSWWWHGSVGSLWSTFIPHSRTVSSLLLARVCPFEVDAVAAGCADTHPSGRAPSGATGHPVGDRTARRDTVCAQLQARRQWRHLVLGLRPGDRSFAHRVRAAGALAPADARLDKSSR